MELVLNDDQKALQTAVRSMLQARATSERVRDALTSEAGYDQALWRELVRDLGVLAIGVPEHLGGADGGQIERTVVSELLGRYRVPVPYLGATMASDVLMALGDPVGLKALARMVEGETLLTIAVHEVGSTGLVDVGCATSAVEGPEGWLLNGAKTNVVWGSAASELLVHAMTADGPAWFLVDPAAEGVVPDSLRSFDPARRLSGYQFHSAPGIRLLGDAEAALRHASLLAQVTLGGEQIGGMTRCLETAVEFAKSRIQFGRIIGSYQAVKHNCADMYLHCELGTSLLRYAAWCADHDQGRSGEAAAVMQAYLGPAYFTVASMTIRCLGGVGYTWEHDAQLFYKHAKSCEGLLDSPIHARRKLADIHLGRLTQAGSHAAS